MLAAFCADGPCLIIVSVSLSLSDYNLLSRYARSLSVVVALAISYSDLDSKRAVDGDKSNKDLSACERKTLQMPSGRKKKTHLQPHCYGYCSTNVMQPSSV